MQDISDLPNLTNEHWQSIEQYNPVHNVRFEKKSILFKIRLYSLFDGILQVWIG